MPASDDIVCCPHEFVGVSLFNAGRVTLVAIRMACEARGIWVVAFTARGLCSGDNPAAVASEAKAKNERLQREVISDWDW